VLPGSRRQDPLGHHLGRALVLVSLSSLLALLPSPTLAQVSPGPLSHAHAELEGNRNCLKCHGRGEAALRQRCLECHHEIEALLNAERGLHAKSKGTDCARCHPEHGGTDFELIQWEGDSPDRFDHQQAGFPLEGKHARARCQECHKPEFQRPPIKPLLTSKHPEKSFLALEPACSSCHDDVHRGALGADCRSCHGLEAWKPAVSFDHAKTAFPLTGKHAPVECGKCHLSPRLKLASDAQGRPVPLYKPLPHAECSDCHEDKHTGRLGPRCASCHVATGWAQVEKSSFDHSRTRYPLLGRHLSVACAACHDPRNPQGARPPFERCGSCHADAHAGKATLKGQAADCAACHRVEGWKPSTYTVAQHDSAPYPLAGRHRLVACGVCHSHNPAGVAAADLGKAGTLLRRLHARCRDCHQEAHGTQLARRADGGACESCHTVDGWKPTSYGATQHATTRLPLDGRHQRATCEACHGPKRAGLPPLPGPEALGKAGVALTGLPVECTSCHLDPHEGRFAAGGGRPREKGCLACHDTVAFRPSRMDAATHRDAAFPLEGAHRAIPCLACHAELKAPPGAASLVNSGGVQRKLSFVEKHDRCEVCHATPHGSQFAARKDGGACESCHDTEGFRPASRFNHQRDVAFVLDGAHAKVPCGRCHPSQPAGDGKMMTLFRPLPLRCEACHQGGRQKMEKPPAAEHS